MEIFEIVFVFKEHSVLMIGTQDAKTFYQIVRDSNFFPLHQSELLHEHVQ